MDALVCAIKLLVGQMQAEAEVRYRIAEVDWYTPTEQRPWEDAEYVRRVDAWKAAVRRAAGLRMAE